MLTFRRFPVTTKPVATRKVGGAVLNAIAGKVPWLIGGSADLSPSTNTFIKSSGYFQSGAYQNRNVAWGIREFTMGGCCCGMALHGGTIPYGATFFVFPSDYARPAMRLAALMEQQAIFVMTHDSIGLGEDGPTHQPIEHLASLRAMPEINVIRPADANETAQAWRAAMLRKDGPTVLVLSRQNLPVLDQSKFGLSRRCSQGCLCSQQGTEAQSGRHSNRDRFGSSACPECPGRAAWPRYRVPCGEYAVLGAFRQAECGVSGRSFAQERY